MCVVFNKVSDLVNKLSNKVLVFNIILSSSIRLNINFFNSFLIEHNATQFIRPCQIKSLYYATERSVGGTLILDSTVNILLQRNE